MALGRSRLVTRGMLGALAVATAMVGAPVASADLVWTWEGLDSAGVGRADLDGSHRDDSYVSGLDQVSTAALRDRRIYFYDAAGLHVRERDGSGETVLGTSAPADFLAANSQFVLWSDPAQIGRANLDGTGVVEPWVSGRPDAVDGVAADDAHVYWLEGDTVRRADLAGQVDAGWAATAPDALGGIGVGGGYVYFARPADGAVGRASIANPLDVQANFVTGLGLPLDVAANATHVYWSDVAGEAIGRAAHAGPIERGLVESVPGVFGVAVDDSDASLALGQAPAFPDQAAGTVGPALEVSVRNEGWRPVTVSRVRVASDDFRMADDSCVEPIPPQAECSVWLRFAPMAAGPANGSLVVVSDTPGATSVRPLSATATAPPPGPSGTPGAAGPPGPAGPMGPAGRRGRDARVRLVTCRTVVHKGGRKRAKPVRRCTSRLLGRSVRIDASPPARARLSRRGRVVARGAARRGRLVLHSRRALRPGRYTLVLVRGDRRTRQVVTLR
jgi:hypothetical protein